MIHKAIILLFILWMVFVKTSCGQDKCDDIKLLKIACENVIENQIKKGEQVIYIDRLSSWDWLINKINSQDTFGKQPKPIIVLTKNDKESILEQIKTFEQFIWQDSLFENSKRIDYDSMWPVINRENKKRFKTISEAMAQKDTITANTLIHK